MRKSELVKEISKDERLPEITVKRVLEALEGILVEEAVTKGEGGIYGFLQVRTSVHKDADGKEYPYLRFKPSAMFKTLFKHFGVGTGREHILTRHNWTALLAYARDKEEEQKENRKRDDMRISDDLLKTPFESSKPTSLPPEPTVTSSEPVETPVTPVETSVTHVETPVTHVETNTEGEVGFDAESALESLLEPYSANPEPNPVETPEPVETPANTVETPKSEETPKTTENQPKPKDDGLAMLEELLGF